MHRIIEVSHKDHTTFVIQKRFYLFFWFDITVYEISTLTLAVKLLEDISKITRKVVYYGKV